MARDSPWIDKPGLFIQGCPVGLSIVFPVREPEIGGLDLDLAANGSCFAANRLDPRMASVSLLVSRSSTKKGGTTPVQGILDDGFGL